MIIAFIHQVLLGFSGYGFVLCVSLTEHFCVTLMPFYQIRIDRECREVH